MPIELEVEGFRSFTQRAVIKFPEVTKGAVLINGKYLDGSTSSGSGKSSLLQAMAFALDFCDIPTTELKSWYSSKLYVRFRLSDGENTYDIIRDPKLSLVVNGEEYKGTASGAKEKLQEILKATPELVKTLTYRPQRQRGMFLSNTDSQNKEFLTQVLDLESIEKALDGFNVELSVMLNKVGVLEASIKSTVDAFNGSQVSEDTIKAGRHAYESAVARLNEITNTNDISTELKNQIGLIETEISTISKAEYEARSARDQIESIKFKLVSIKKEIDTLMAGICYTCKREWQPAQDLITAKESEMTKLVESMKYNMTIIKNAEPLLDPAHKQNLLNSRSDLNLKLGQLSAPINDALMSKNSAEMNLMNLMKMKENSIKLKADITQKTTELSDMKINLEVITHCVRLLDRQGFLGNIFDEVLADIKNRTNDLMASIPNVNTFSIDISSNSVTQKGKVNKKIKTSVYKDGEEKSLRSLSGGQMTSSELCTDLAVGEAIRSRSGSNLGWVALDEAMDGLDVETKKSVLEVIKSKINGLVIVVDHSTEIKDAFDQVIEVEFDGKNSYVV
jgi:DNA repair exonuclease SbcCD ATPase subunit